MGFPAHALKMTLGISKATPFSLLQHGGIQLESTSQKTQMASLPNPPPTFIFQDENTEVQWDLRKFHKSSVELVNGRNWN